MGSEIAASLGVLKAELKRLDALCADPHRVGAPTLPEARRAISLAIDALTVAARVEQASPRQAPLSAASGPRLLDRVVLIEPSQLGDTFRTKIKIKSADLEPPPPMPAAGPIADDLTRIRGIDAALAVNLADAGVAKFAQIAGWTQADVRRLTDLLGLGRQISRQNWIEQAALLCPRGVPPVTPVAPVAIEPARLDLPTAATVTTAASGSQLVAAPLAPAATLPTAQQAEVEPAPLPVAPDRLELISGLSVEIAAALQRLGVTRWSQIAAWRRSDIAGLSDHFAQVAPIGKQGWIEQAAILASGRMTGHAARILRGDFTALVPAPAAEELPAPVFAEWAPMTPAPSIEVPAARPAAITLEADTALLVLAEPAPALDAVADAPAVEAAPPTAGAALPPTDPLDRVTALEQELAALVANDTSAAHRPQAPAPSPPPVRSDRASRLHIEDEEFAALQVGEADVVIVKAQPPAQPDPVERKLPDASARSLLARFKRSTPLDDIDNTTYAGYRDQVEEASVEIVRPDTKSRAAGPRVEQPATPGHRPINRLLHPFKRGS